MMVVAQWLIPGKTIWEYESVLMTGELHKFRTLPVDPNDPFRGKYITLRFPDIPMDSILLNGTQEYAYCLLAIDSLGFSTVDQVLLTEPTSTQAYFRAEIERKSNKSWSWKRTKIGYPFERFYMEEHKAPKAENFYNTASRDTQQTVYATVRIKNGMTVLEDVFIDGHSISEIEDND